jgi:hypothetical protein
MFIFNVGSRGDQELKGLLPRFPNLGLLDYTEPFDDGRVTDDGRVRRTSDDGRVTDGTFKSRRTGDDGRVTRRDVHPAK